MYIQKTQMLDTKHHSYMMACIDRKSNFYAKDTSVTLLNVDGKENVKTFYRIFYSYDAIIGIATYHLNTHPNLNPNYKSEEYMQWECDSLLENANYFEKRSTTTARHITLMKTMCDNAKMDMDVPISYMTNDDLLTWINENIEDIKEGHDADINTKKTNA